MKKGVDLRDQILSERPNGPICSFAEIEELGREAFGEAFAAVYFLEERYGRDRLSQFRAARLKLDKEKGRGAASRPVFLSIYGKDEVQLDKEWREFFGWRHGGLAPPGQVALEVVKELASARYEGRAAGSPGERLAARTIAQYLQRIGCPPLGRGGYWQPFKVAYRDLVGPVGLSVGAGRFEYLKDFTVVEGGPPEWVAGQVVFAGYGRSEGGGNDWRGVDARGKVVMILKRDGGPSEQAAIIEGAVEHGAVGMLLVDPHPQGAGPDAYRYKNIRLKDRLPALHVSRRVGEVILTGSEISLEELKAAADRDEAVSLGLNTAVRMAAGAIYRPDSQSANIVGLLPSPRNPDRYILLCAHYDGQGRAGDGSHYPGANDNASGVGVMLEVATELAKRRNELPVSVICAALGAEEVGLVGARNLVKNPPFSSDKVVLAINLDMVGTGEGTILIQNTSTQMPAYVRLIEVAAGLGIRTKSLARRTLGGDAGILQKSGTPTLFLLTGGVKQHTPDDGPENVSQETMSKVCALLTKFIMTYADAGKVVAPKQ